MYITKETYNPLSLMFHKGMLSPWGNESAQQSNSSPPDTFTKQQTAEHFHTVPLRFILLYQLKKKTLQRINRTTIFTCSAQDTAYSTLHS